MTQIHITDGDASTVPTAASARTIHRTAFVHSLSLTELEVVPDALICVGPEGGIEWVERLDESAGRIPFVEVLREFKRAKGLEGDLKGIWMKEGFMCPGMIDTHTVSGVWLVVFGMRMLMLMDNGYGRVNERNASLCSLLMRGFPATVKTPRVILLIDSTPHSIRMLVWARISSCSNGWIR